MTNNIEIQRSKTKRESFSAKILEFYNIFEKDCIPILKDYEDKRKKILLQNNLIIVGLVLIGILAYYYNKYTMFTVITNPTVISIQMIISIAIVIVAFSLEICNMSKQNVKFKNELKNNCFNKFLKIFGDIHWHSVKKEDNTQGTDVTYGDDNIRFSQSGLFINYNTRYTDDIFEGTYKNIPFVITETKMYDIHGSGKHRTCIEAFRGIIIEFQSNKEVKNRTIVSTKGDLTKKSNKYIALAATIPVLLNLSFTKHGFSSFGLILSLIIIAVVFIVCYNIKSDEEPLNKVSLEDTEFDKKFEVYSSDQIEARYLVTTSFIERFKNMQTAFGNSKAKCSFYDRDKFMIAIHSNQDLFEIGDLYHPLLNKENYKKIFNTFNSIFDLIDYFKLDEKTGL